MKIFKTIRLLAGSAVLLIAPALQAQIVNGDFETGNFTGWTQSGNTDFTGVGTNVSFTPGTAHSGTFGAFFGPVGSVGFIEQDIATTAGASYDISFWLRHLGGTPSVFTLDWDGASVTSMSDPSAFDYTLFSFSVLATDASSTLKFGFREDPSFFILDDVSVTRSTSAVPEPSTYGLMAAAGLLAAVAIRRRKTKQQA